MGRAKLHDHSRAFNTVLVSALEQEVMLDGADAIVHSALAREESRGLHARRDFPRSQRRVIPGRHSGRQAAQSRSDPPSDKSTLTWSRPPARAQCPDEPLRTAGARSYD